MTKRFSTSRMINFGDCDPAQIVYYPRFFEMFDRNTENMFRSHGVHWEKLHADGEFSGMPLLDVHANFKVRVPMGQTVEIQTWIDEFRGKTFVVRHELYNGDVLCCENRELRAYVIFDSSTEAGVRAVPMPDALRAKLSG
jgi:4-hydroxybenzoyl-CoA thioesterase